MELTWSKIIDEFAVKYSELCHIEVDSKATKMMVSRFKKRVLPNFSSCSEFIHCDETKLVKRVSQLGKRTEAGIAAVRKKFCEDLAIEKENQEKDSRFADYKAKCDAELKVMKANLEKMYNPKVDAEFLSCFITGLESHGVKLKDVEIDLSTIEAFRKCIKIKNA